MASRKIEDLEPVTQQKVLALLQRCAREGILLKVTSTYRTWAEQAEIYAQGRTKPGKKVTNAPPGYSWHNFRRAADLADIDASPFDLGNPGLQDDDPIWEKIGDHAEAVGLEWGGRWKTPDRPHVEDHGGMTLAEARIQHLESHPEDRRLLA